MRLGSFQLRLIERHWHAGDHSRHLLYRLIRGEFQSGMKPRAAVILVGINDIRSLHGCASGCNRSVVSCCSALAFSAVLAAANNSVLSLLEHRWCC